jgi:hypothetical protein
MVEQHIVLLENDKKEEQQIFEKRESDLREALESLERRWQS